MNEEGRVGVAGERLRRLTLEGSVQSTKIYKISQQTM